MTQPGRGVRWALVVGVTFAAASCVSVTVNVTFPQEKIEGAAASIEDLVRGGKAEPPASPPAKKDDKQGSVRAPGRWLAFFSPVTAEAQVAQIPELKTRTPEVMASIESRRQRFPAIQQWKTRGCIGENAQGLVEARPGQGCGSEVGGLISAENRDRLTLYQTLLQQNNMPPGDLARIQAAFAKVNREKAGAGEWIQSETGQWTRK